MPLRIFQRFFVKQTGKIEKLIKSAKNRLGLQNIIKRYH